MQRDDPTTLTAPLVPSMLRPCPSCAGWHLRERADTQTADAVAATMATLPDGCRAPRPGAVRCHQHGRRQSNLGCAAHTWPSGQSAVRPLSQKVPLSSPHRAKGLPSMFPKHRHNWLWVQFEQSRLAAVKQAPWTTAWPVVQHLPLMHKGLPSLQRVPWATVGLEHCPVAGSQVPGPWH
jgi:hypothetical protein